MNFKIPINISKFFAVIILFQLISYLLSVFIFNNVNLFNNIISFDVSYYKVIAEYGYQPINSQNYIPEAFAFFPSASIFLKLFSFLVFGNLNLSLVLYMIIMPILLSIFIYKYVLNSSLKKFEINSFVSSFFYLIIPFGFFFTVAYSEIIFALSFILFYRSILSASNKYFLLAVSSIFLILSRPNSVVIIPASILFILYLLFKKENRVLLKKLITSVILQVITILALFSYHYYLVGDFFAARNAQSLWGRSTKTTFNGFNLFERTVNNVTLATAHCSKIDVICYAKANFAVYGFFLWMISTILVYFKVKKTPFNTFLQLINLFMIILPISSGSIGSFNRYMLLSPIVLIFFPQYLKSVFDKYKYFFPFFVILNILFLTLFYNNIWLG